MSRKSDPERLERQRRLEEQAREAHAYLQAVMDRHEARIRADAERRERRRRLLRRLFPFGRPSGA